MSSTKFFGFLWLITLLAFAAAFGWAELHYIPPEKAPENGDAQNAKKTITVKAVDALQEPFLGGFLPRIAPDGKTAFGTYAAVAPEVHPSVPRIAIIIQRLGFKAKEADYAINNLPAEVSLAFSPYVSDLNALGEKAREKGHEVFIQIPMEPLNTSLVDAGTLALTTDLDADTNMTNMKTAMSQMNGYVGVMTSYGSRFTSQRTLMQPVIDEVKKRGLMYVDQRTTNYTHGPNLAREAQVPFVFKDVEIDRELNAAEISNSLKALEERALRSGLAVGIGSSKLITLRKIEAWAKTLRQKGIVLVPVSSLASKQRNIK